MRRSIVFVCWQEQIRTLENSMSFLFLKLWALSPLSITSGSLSCLALFRGVRIFLTSRKKSVIFLSPIVSCLLKNNKISSIGHSGLRRGENGMVHAVRGKLPFILDMVNAQDAHTGKPMISMGCSLDYWICPELLHSSLFSICTAKDIRKQIRH